jgi:phosphatidylinositol alpha-1,6-mannosyltransferase
MSRYLVITEKFPPKKGGTNLWFDEVYRRLGGKEVHIVTSDIPGGTDYDSTHPNTVHRVSLRRYWWLRPESVLMYIKLLGVSLRLACTYQFDAVHAGRVLPEGLVGWIVARLIRRHMLVIYAHGEEITTWRTPTKLKVMAFVYRSADYVIANSDFTRDELIKLGVDEGHVVSISPGVDVQRFRPGLSTSDLRTRLELNGNQKLILSVGRLTRRKGFDQIIRSLPRLVNQGIDAKYAIIGVGEDRVHLSSLSEELGVQNRVFLLGHVEAEDLPRWYNAADVFAMPNRPINGDTEGFGMVFLEAAACAKPSIAGQGGGTGNAVLHGVTGLRIDGTRTDEVLRNILYLLDNNDVAAKMGKEGYRRVLAHFSWEKVAEKTLLIGKV